MLLFCTEKELISSLKMKKRVKAKGFNSLFHVRIYLYDLEQIEFQVVCFRYAKDNRMVGRLLAGFYLAQGNFGI